MGVVGSKSTLERRNTVIRRSQRKSIHGIKSKADKIIKDIKKFKEAEENVAYNALKSRIESLDRELRTSEKHLQPQVRNIHKDTLTKVEECYKLLENKLKENQEKVVVPVEEKKQEDNTSDDVFTEETDEDRHERKRVELNLVQVELIQESPKVSKRSSLMKIGVPVFPSSMSEALHNGTQDSETVEEDKISKIREKIQNLEVDISQFVGKRGGKYYNKIKEQLKFCSDDLQNIPCLDEDTMDQMKLCENYIASCLSFLEEKAVDEESSSENEDSLPEVQNNVENDGTNSFAPRTMRTTYI